MIGDKYLNQFCRVVIVKFWAAHVLYRRDQCMVICNLLVGLVALVYYKQGSMFCGHVVHIYDNLDRLFTLSFALRKSLFYLYTRLFRLIPYTGS